MPTLLIVEDNPATRQLLKSALGIHYTVHTATNGEEGLEALEQHLPDLIISDIMMPVMDGQEFHRRLREELGHCDIPFIFLTAKAHVEKQDRLLSTAADHFVRKPFSFKELNDTVRSLLQDT